MGRDVDDAIETAASRTREAQERLIVRRRKAAPTVRAARVVERRADDLHELTLDAVDKERQHEDARADDPGIDPADG